MFLKIDLTFFSWCRDICSIWISITYSEIKRSNFAKKRSCKQAQEVSISRQTQKQNHPPLFLTEVQSLKQLPKNI